MSKKIVSVKSYNRKSPNNISQMVKSHTRKLPNTSQISKKNINSSYTQSIKNDNKYITIKEIYTRKILK
jgi:hypothetical protein